MYELTNTSGGNLSLFDKQLTVENDETIDLPKYARKHPAIQTAEKKGLIDVSKKEKPGKKRQDKTEKNTEKEEKADKEEEKTESRSGDNQNKIDDSEETKQEGEDIPTVEEFSNLKKKEMKKVLKDLDIDDGVSLNKKKAVLTEYYEEKMG